MVSSDCLDWLRFARMDITAAQDLFTKQQNPRHRPIEVILYHCQQGAEKALKAYIIQHRPLTKDLQTHDMQLLRQACARQDAHFNKTRLIGHCANLDPFSIVVRYPKHNLPLDSNLAVRGLNSAKRVYNFVCERLGLDNGHLMILG